MKRVRTVRTDYDTTLTNTSSRLQWETVKASKASFCFKSSRQMNNCDAGARQLMETVRTPGISTIVANDGSSTDTSFCKEVASSEKRNVTL